MSPSVLKKTIPLSVPADTKITPSIFYIYSELLSCYSKKYTATLTDKYAILMFMLETSVNQKTLVSNPVSNTLSTSCSTDCSQNWRSYFPICNCKRTTMQHYMAISRNKHRQAQQYCTVLTCTSVLLIKKSSVQFYQQHAEVAFS